MPSAAQYRNATIRRGYGFLAFEFKVPDGIGAVAQTIFDIPSNCILLDAQLRMLTQGTGAGTVQGRVGTTACTATLANNAAVDTLGAFTAATKGLKTAAATTFNLLPAGTITVGAVVQVLAAFYREEYGS